MNTYPIKDEKGQLYAVEIENAYVGLRALVHLLGTVEGVSDVRSRAPFERSGDIRGTFRFAGAAFPRSACASQSGPHAARRAGQCRSRASAASLIAKVGG
jgi:hypothetical protein